MKCPVPECTYTSKTEITFWVHLQAKHRKDQLIAVIIKQLQKDPET